MPDYLKNPKIRYELHYPDGKAVDVPGEVVGNFTNRQEILGLLLHDAPKGTELRNLRVVDENWEEVPEADQPLLMREPKDEDPTLRTAKGTRQYGAKPPKAAAPREIQHMRGGKVKRAPAPSADEQTEADRAVEAVTGKKPE